MEPFARLPKRVLQDDELNPTARLLFGALDSCQDKRTGRCAPTLNRLAGLVGCDRRTVIRQLLVLEEAGYIAIDRATGRRNSYALLPDVTGDTGVTGPARVTGDTGVTGTRDTGVTGDTLATNYSLKEQEERMPPPPPAAPPFRAPDTHLFADQHRRDFPAEVAYRMGGRPELAGMVGWFPALAAEFWLARGFLVRQTDGRTVADVWAVELARVGATEAEVAEAFAWARVSVTRPGGEEVYDRPGLLREVLRRVKARRPRPAPPAAGGAGPAPAATEADRAWARLPTAEKRELLGAARRDRPGAGWDELRRRCYDLMHERAADVGAHVPTQGG